MQVWTQGRAALALALFAAPAAAQERGEVDRDWTIRAERIYTAAGDVIEGGVVTVSGGRITGVAPGGGGGDDALECAAVTPGLIDLSPRIHTGTFSVEQSDETPIDLDVTAALDLYDYRWGRELRSGVTTVLASPADRAVLGGFGAVIKTGGEPTLEARLVKDRAVLRASMGSEPSSGNRAPRGTRPSTFYYRRPTTRMGVEWVFRKSFYDALAARGDADRADARTAVLESVLSGDVPLACQAWATQDVRTAVYLKEEFGIPRMFVDAAAEAWREPELLVRSGMDVVLPPFQLDGRPDVDDAFYAYDTAKVLHEAGVRIALSGHGSEDPAGRLAYQPGYAMRGGLPFDAALAAVTIHPAQMVGVGDRVGSIEVGKDADLVLWSGTPFELTSRVVGVLLNGELVLDPRSSDR